MFEKCVQLIAGVEFNPLAAINLIEVLLCSLAQMVDFRNRYELKIRAYTKLTGAIAADTRDVAEGDRIRIRRNPAEGVAVESVQQLDPRLYPYAFSHGKVLLHGDILAAAPEAPDLGDCRR